MDFFLGLPMTKGVLTQYLWWLIGSPRWHILFHATRLMMQCMFNFFFRELVTLHGIQKKIVSNRDKKNCGVFLEDFVKEVEERTKV